MVSVLLSVLGLPHISLADSDNTDKPWSVLLITVDCMRPDHMSVYGYERNTTPNLERFAQEALVFENAFATSAWTSPGIVSMLTGYYPPVHGQNGKFSFYDAEMASPLRLFVERGYEALGQAIKGPSHANLGFERGLKKTNGLEDFIERQSVTKEPFVAWIHTKETHLPYAPSERNRIRWVDSSQTSEGIEAVQNFRVVFRPDDVQVTFRHPGKVKFTQEDVPVIRALYDAEMADIDERLGSAIERMRATGLLDRTIVIISADHGEELFEHGWIGHASTSYDGKLYDELIRIPLLIRLPDKSLTGRYSALVQSVDIMPTLFDILGMDSSRVKPAMQGHSLMPLIKSKRTSIRNYVFAETTRRGWTNPKTQMRDRVTAVRTSDRKLIRTVNQGQMRFEAYDLVTDPEETRNVYSQKADQFQDLEQILAKWYETNRNVAASLVIPAAQKQLKAMIEGLQQGDLITAVDRWRNIAVMHNTWGLELVPFYQHEPYQSQWKQLRFTAAHQLAQAMRCDAETGMWRRETTGKLVNDTLWVCQ